MEQLKQDQITEKLLIVLSKHLKFTADPQTIPLDKPLDELGLDSMGAVNLLLDLEDNFAISFPGSLISEDTFRTAANLHKAVSSLV